MTVVWLAETQHKAGPSFRMGRDGDTLVAEWPGLGVLTVDRHGEHPRFAANASADPLALEKLQANTMQALLRHLRGGLTLHASAAADCNGAVAFIGDSGAGKSTLAFAVVRNHGFSLLSDDCLPIADGLALPVDRTSWIDDSAKAAMGLRKEGGKSPVAVPHVAEESVPLRWIVHLKFEDRVSIKRLRGRSVAGVLTRAAIRFVIDEPAVLREDLEQLARLAMKTEILELSRPPGFEHLPSTVAALRKVLS